jgi:hypothetical protein
MGAILGRAITAQSHTGATQTLKSLFTASAVFSLMISVHYQQVWYNNVNY